MKRRSTPDAKERSARMIGRDKRRVVRRIGLTLAVLFVTLALGGGVALAAGAYCTSDPCYGTSGPDILLGTRGGETIAVFGGNDYVGAREGRDTVYGGRGADRIGAVDGQRDVIDCGRGRSDAVRYDLVLDTIKNCEKKYPDIPIIH
jgi:RTX calcium-binding nonapeptide repeat (4 copies)